jgi:hypothetical protein
MKERGIAMAGWSVRAVRAGRKTQTRRLVNENHLFVDLRRIVVSDPSDLFPRHQVQAGRHRVRLNPQGAVVVLKPTFGLKPGEFHWRCPLVDGDTHLAARDNGRKVWTVTPTGEQRLYTRETYSLDARTVYPCPPVCPPVWYRADFESPHDDPSSGDHVRHCTAAKGGVPQADCYACAMSRAPCAACRAR